MRALPRAHSRSSSGSVRAPGRANRPRSDQTNRREDGPPSRLLNPEPATSCYCRAWRGLHRRTTPASLGFQHPETTPPLIPTTLRTAPITGSERRLNFLFDPTHPRTRKAKAGRSPGRPPTLPVQLRAGALLRRLVQMLNTRRDAAVQYHDKLAATARPSAFSSKFIRDVCARARAHSGQSKSASRYPSCSTLVAVSVPEKSWSRLAATSPLSGTPLGFSGASRLP